MTDQFKSSKCGKIFNSQNETERTREELQQKVRLQINRRNVTWRISTVLIRPDFLSHSHNLTRPQFCSFRRPE
jgi:hypothetical protein